MSDLAPTDLLVLLERLIQSLGITLRYEVLGDEDDHSPTRSGICRLKKERIVLIDSRLTALEKTRVLADELKHFDLSQVYIPPVVRRLIDAPEHDI